MVKNKRTQWDSDGKKLPEEAANAEAPKPEVKAPAEQPKEKQLGLFPDTNDGKKLPEKAAPAEAPKPEVDTKPAFIIPSFLFNSLVPQDLKAVSECKRLEYEEFDQDLVADTTIKGDYYTTPNLIKFKDGATWDPLNWYKEAPSSPAKPEDFNEEIAKDKAAAPAPKKSTKVGKTNWFRRSVIGLATVAMLSGIGGMCYNNYSKKEKCSWIPDKNVKEICYRQESIFGVTSGEEKSILNNYYTTNQLFSLIPKLQLEKEAHITAKPEYQKSQPQKPAKQKKSGFFKKLLDLGYNFRSPQFSGYKPAEDDKNDLAADGKRYKQEMSLSLDAEKDRLCALADSSATEYAAKNKQELRLKAFNQKGESVENKLDDKGYGCVKLDKKDYELAALAIGEKLVIASSQFNDKTHDENIHKMQELIASEAGMDKEGLEEVIENKAPYMLDSMIINKAEKGKPFDAVLSAQDPEKDKVSIKLMNPEKYTDIGLEINEIPDEVLASAYNQQVALTSKNPVTQDNLEFIVCAADETHPVSDIVPGKCMKYDVSMDGSKKVVATPIEKQKVAEVAAEDNLSVPFEPSAEAGSTADQIVAEAASEIENPYTLSLRPRFQIKHGKTLFELEKSEKQPNDLRRYYLPSNFMEERLNGMIVHTDSGAKQLNYTWYTADGGSTTTAISLNRNGNAKLKHRNIPKDAVALKLDDLVSKDSLVIGTGLDIPAFSLFLGEEKVSYTSIDENGNARFDEIAPGDYVLRKNPAEKVLHDNYAITAKLNDQDISSEGDSMNFHLSDGDKLQIRVEGHSAVDVDEIYISVGSKPNGNSAVKENPSPLEYNAAPAETKQPEAKEVPAQTESKTPAETKAPAAEVKANKEPASEPEKDSLYSKVKLSGNFGMFNKSSTYEAPAWKQETELSGWNTGVEGSYKFSPKLELGADINYGNANGKIKNLADLRTDRLGIGVIAKGSYGKKDSLHIEPSVSYSRIMSNTKLDLSPTIEQNKSTDRLAGSAIIAYDKFGVDLGGIFDGEKISQKTPDFDDYGIHRALWAGTFVDINQFMVELYIKNMSRYNYELERDLTGNSAGLYAGFNGKVGVSLAGEVPVSNDNQEYLFSGGISIPLYKDKIFLNLNGNYSQMNYDEGPNEVKENSYGGSIGVSNFNKIKDRIKPFHLEQHNLN